MSQQLSEPFIQRPSILRSQSPRVFVTPPPEDISEYVQYQAEFIDIIPATNRPVWRLTYDNGKLVHFRPTPNASLDPFSHAVFNQQSEGEKCWIEACEYCALCEEYFIDPHTLQTSLIPEGCRSLKWDPYFHWMMNEQIPRLHNKGSLNTGICWIGRCQYPHCDSSYQMSISTENSELLGCPCKELKTQAKKNRRRYFFACGCGNKKLICGNEDVCYIRQTGRFGGWPVEICPHWSKRRWLQFSLESCCAKCSVMAKLVTRGLDKPTRLTFQKKQHSDTIYRRIAFALSPLAVDPEATPKEKWEDYEHVFFNLPREALRVFKHVTFVDDEKSSCEDRCRKFTRVRAPSPHPTLKLTSKCSRRRDPSSDGYESDIESMSREPFNKYSRKRKSTYQSKTRRRRCHAPRVARMDQGRVSYRRKSVQRKLPENQIKTSEIFATGAIISLDKPPGSERSIISMPTDSAVTALRAIRHRVSASNTTFSAPIMSLNSPLAPSTLPQVNAPVGEACPSSDADEEERFTQWLNQIEGGWNEPGSSKTVKLEPISFWRKIKILTGWEEDPNVCRYCAWCKTACMCQIQQEDGSWVMCRDLVDEA